MAVLCWLSQFIGRNYHYQCQVGKPGYTQQVLSQSQQQYTNTTIPFKRGSITDRNGTILANSVKVYNLVLDCVEINKNPEKYKEPTKAALEEYFGIDQDTVEDLLTGDDTKASQYQILQKEVTMEEKKAFEASLEIPEDEEEKKALGEEEVTRSPERPWNLL